MSDWKEHPIFSLGEVITGKTPSKNNPEDWGYEVPFITPSDYKNYRKYAANSERWLSREGAERLSKKILPPKSVLVTCIGSDMGKVVMNTIPVITNQQINSVIPDQNIVYADFLYYQLINIYDILRVFGGDGTAVPIVNKTDFEKIELSLPPLPVQKAIASVLSSLDDKIDLLHRQNKTLEAMAETLFRQWFVESNNQEYGKLGELVKTTSGGTPSRKILEYYENGLINWVKSKELNGGFIFDTEEKINEQAVLNSSAKLLPQFSILIAMYGATVGEYSILAKPATCNQAICALIPNDEYPYTFLYFIVKTNKDDLINMAVGSAQQNISQVLIKQLDIPQPSKQIKLFHDEAKVIFSKILNNSQQIHTLEKLRDTLLPKLMSGEVRVG